MARKPRVVVVGMPHDVTQRGNNGQRIFFRLHDRQVYLGALFDYVRVVLRGDDGSQEWQKLPRKWGKLLLSPVAQFPA